MKEKTYFIILFSLFFVMVCKRASAQNGQVQTTRTIHVATAGTLPNLLSEDEKYQIEELTLTGELNGTDLGFLREMAGKSREGWCHMDLKGYIVIDECYIADTQGNLRILDISNVNIVSGGNPPFFVLDSDFKYTNIYSLDNIMPDYLFYSCRLISIKLPKSISSIGKYALSGCPISSINITDGVTSIGVCAFQKCSNLTSITVDSGNTKYDSRENCNAIIEKSSKTLVAGCKNTIIPNNVMSIGNYAFYGCSGLTSIEIPNNVTSIGMSAFYGCSVLTSITIPNSVTSIGNGAFSGCSGLTSVTIPNSVTTIGDQVFYGCSGLTSIEIPNNVSSIGIYSFRGCSGLTSVTIPESVTSIGSYAFYGTTWYNNQPDGFVYAGKVAYEYKGTMPANTSLSLKDGTLGIAGNAFVSCRGLSSITIPNSVTSIGDNAFWECSGLSTIISEIENPFEINNNVFYGIPSDAQLIVPKGTKAKYQATAGWNQFTNIMEAGEEPDPSGQIHKDDIYFKVIGSGEAEVVSVEEGEKIVSIPSTISHNNTTYKVTSISKEVFENREYLAAVIWEPEAQFNAEVSNPNFLLYVKDEKYASRNVKNVVVNNVAESIELSDASGGNDFYCPRSFTARKISYSHHYNMETGLGDSKGWETIVLPFDVQNYSHATKGELETFTTWTMGSNKKPFWLFELTAGGYKDVAGIKANTPYIISMPNNRQYEQQYQIPGVVTFSATNVEVKKSDDLKPVSYQGKTFVPNYANKAGDDVLALNVNSYYVPNPGKETDGSKFIRGLRAVHPFEAYMTTSDGTRSIDVMDGLTTDFKGIGMVKDGECDMKVYDVRGILLKTSSSMDEVRKGLKAGVYIVNGKKIIIK